MILAAGRVGKSGGSKAGRRANTPTKAPPKKGRAGAEAAAQSQQPQPGLGSRRADKHTAPTATDPPHVTPDPGHSPKSDSVVVIVDFSVELLFFFFFIFFFLLFSNILFS